MTRKWMVLAISLPLFGCADEDAAMDGALMTDTMPTSTMPETAPRNAGTLTDPQIAAIVATANSIDVSAGELATQQAENAEVRQFAERMVSDHTASNQQVTDLAARLGVTPEPTETSMGLQQSADAALQRLSGLSGAEFDRAYIQHEVQFHQQVLDAIDQTLLPNASNADLRRLIEQTRPVIEGHLGHARQVAEGLGAGTTRR